MSCGCGCSDVCGCCEGVEPVTPVALVNRPGLDALAYRVGTHGRFLETMLARLSLHELALQTGASDEHGRPVVELSRPLGALRTREPDDPSIALLDAWATVADVLTFYQERIANEGYLRTATERRSVLELGRLLGYRLRPGVAATCFLAYKLEPGAKTKIAARSKVQSVPRPGELPQTFETVEEAEARGDWNSLQVATTRPVDAGALADVSRADTRALYFAGVATRLEPNAPLLADFGSAQELYRIVDVEPDAAADRTKVFVQPWTMPAGEVAVAALETPPAPASDVVGVLEDVVARFSNLSAADAPRPGAAVRRVLAVLERLQTNLVLGIGEHELRELFTGDILPALNDELRRARGRSARIEAWLGRLVGELEDLRPDPEPGALAAILVSTSDPAGHTTIGGALDGLAKPPSQQPASGFELRPGLDTTFGASSATLPSLLTSMRPELASVLYDAWRNLEATPPLQLRIYALRARAAPFGNAAPPQTVLNADGIVTGTREWTLTGSDGTGRAQRFSVRLVIPTSTLGSPPPIAGIEIEFAGSSAEMSFPAASLFDGTVNVDVPGLADPVRVTGRSATSSPPAPRSVTIAFPGDRLTLRCSLELGAQVSWSSDGSDPTSLAYSITGGPDIELTAVNAPQAWTVRVEGSHRSAGGTPTEDPFVVSLDSPRPAIVPGGWAVVERPELADGPPTIVIARITGVREVSRNDYGTTGRSTLVSIDEPWLRIGSDGDDFGVIRGSTVFAQSEALELLDEPLDPVAEPICDDEIPLERLYEGLEPGRRLIVSGERTDLTAAATAQAEDGEDEDEDEVAVAGVRAVEVVMLAAVRHEVDPREPAARTRSTIVLAEPLAYCYRRDTITINANVLKATHGETREEVLGSGDGTRPHQSFELGQKPLTHVSAVTPTGIASTLEVSVDRVRWHEVDGPVGLSPGDRRWSAATNDDDVTTVTFGNGVEGARLPTGVENVTAVYRFGIGRGGNVAAGQLTLLGTQPSGVVAVTNPQAASGGANRESRDQARSNIPLAVTALDRIVSVQDYADFARTFAGIGKASSARLTNGRQQIVHLTIAGEEDIPILATSDVYRNLNLALAEFGEPFQPFRVDVRRLLTMVAVINVARHPDHRWDDVAQAVRAALLDRFSFQRRELGQDVARSEVLSVVQRVTGVVYADLDILDTVDEERIVRELMTPSPKGLAGEVRLRERLRAQLAGAIPEPQPTVLPAELIVLDPSVPQTLTLLEIAP